jgi:hypothetical protein
MVCQRLRQTGAALPGCAHTARPRAQEATVRKYLKKDEHVRAARVGHGRGRRGAGDLKGYISVFFSGFCAGRDV